MQSKLSHLEKINVLKIYTLSVTKGGEAGHRKWYLYTAKC